MADNVFDISKERLKHTPAGAAENRRFGHPPADSGGDRPSDSECPDRGFAEKEFHHVRARAMTGPPKDEQPLTAAETLALVNLGRGRPLTGADLPPRVRP